MNLASKLEKYLFIEQITQTAEAQGVLSYLVGGYVRDLILEKDGNDIDILVIGDSNKFAHALANNLGVAKVVTFKTYGTASFKYHDINFEFVTARKESYNKDSRKPDVVEGSFQDDISRRDFTINTLAVSINKKNFGELIDIYNGLEDIKKKIIRSPVNPLITFDDDPLRILRAFRFASQLNFTVHDSVIGAANKLKDRLTIVSQERITTEFFKILSSSKPSIGLRLLYDSRVMKIIFPEITNLAGIDQRDDHHHKDVFLHTCKVVDNISEKTENVWLRFAALVHDIAKPQTKRFVEGTGWTFHGHEEIGARMMKKIFHRMKLPLGNLHYIENLVRLHLRPIALAKDEVTDSAVRRLIVSAGDDLEDLITLCRADITSKNPDKVSKYLQNYNNVMQKVVDVKGKDELRAFQSPVKGEEIMKIFNLKPSKEVGIIKKAIEEAILDGKINNNYEEAYEYLLQLKKQSSHSK